MNELPTRLVAGVEKDTQRLDSKQVQLDVQNDEVVRIRDIVREKTWFGFDLDDTLHEFRWASGKATTAALNRISESYGISLSDLTTEYIKILKEKTSNAFSDGKTSFEYRQERFTSVLSKFNLPDDQMASYLDLYEKTIIESLKLKSGALDLLAHLNKIGKKVIVVTEGPQDAQERTIEALSIKEHVDFLATTNHFKITKTTGLLEKVITHLGIEPSDMVYIGDSWERDIIPASAEGIFAIHLDEKNPPQMASSPIRINSLGYLTHILLFED